MFTCWEKDDNDILEPVYIYVYIEKWSSWAQRTLICLHISPGEKWLEAYIVELFIFIFAEYNSASEYKKIYQDSL